jgi:hypothetical protein
VEAISIKLRKACTLFRKNSLKFLKFSRRAKLTLLDPEKYKPKICTTIFDDSKKEAIIVLDDKEYLNYRLKCKRPPKLLDEIYVSFLMVLKIESFRLYSEFEQVIQLIDSSGLLEFYVKTMRWNQFTKKFTVLPDISLKVFSLQDLGFGFVPWLCACAVSVITFSLEIICSIILKLLKRTMKVKLIKYFNRIISKFDRRSIFKRIKTFKRDKLNMLRRKINSVRLQLKKVTK